MNTESAFTSTHCHLWSFWHKDERTGISCCTKIYEHQLPSTKFLTQRQKSWHQLLYKDLWASSVIYEALHSVLSYYTMNKHLVIWSRYVEWECFLMAATATCAANTTNERDCEQSGTGDCCSYKKSCFNEAHGIKYRFVQISSDIYSVVACFCTDEWQENFHTIKTKTLTLWEVNRKE